VCLLTLQVGASACVEGHYHISDSLDESTNNPTYKIRLKRYDPDTPPGEEPELVVIQCVDPADEKYTVAPTIDPGVWVHYWVGDIAHESGGMIPGFCAFRLKKVIVEGQETWVEEEEIPVTWHP